MKNIIFKLKNLTIIQKIIVLITSLPCYMFIYDLEGKEDDAFSITLILYSALALIMFGKKKNNNI